MISKTGVSLTTALQHRICLYVPMCICTLLPRPAEMSKDPEKHQASFGSCYTSTAAGKWRWTSGSLRIQCNIQLELFLTAQILPVSSTPLSGIVAGLWPILGVPFIPLPANCSSSSMVVRPPHGYSCVTLFDQVVGATWSMSQDQGILKSWICHGAPLASSSEQAGSCCPVLPLSDPLWADLLSEMNHVITGQTAPGFGS